MITLIVVLIQMIVEKVEASRDKLKKKERFCIFAVSHMINKW